MSTTEGADSAAAETVGGTKQSPKAIRERAARLGYRIKRRGGRYELIRDGESDGTCTDRIRDFAPLLDLLESGKPVQYSTACGIPLFTHDSKTGQTIYHQTGGIENADGQANPPANNVQALVDLAAGINAAHEQVERAFHDGVNHAIRAGELLLLAKKQIPHGKWEAWLKSNVSFRPRTARAYMQIAELDGPKRQLVADLPMREALKAIAQRKYLTPEELNPGRSVERKAMAIYTPPDRPVVECAPLTPQEEADELIRRPAECAAPGDVTISNAELSAAFKRRFGLNESQDTDGNPIWLAWCVATPKQRCEFVYLGWSDIEKVREVVNENTNAD